MELVRKSNMCELSLFCIQNYGATTMTTYEKYRKLRTVNSLETDCTLDDNWDRSIKINVISPKGNFGSGKLKLVAEEMPSQNDLAASRKALGKNLINVPELSKKQPDISLLDASNMTQQLQGERIRISGKSLHRGSDCFDDSMDFREMNITYGSRNLAGEDQLSNQGVKNIISQQNGLKQSIRKQEGHIRRNFRREQQLEEVNMRKSEVESEVNFDEEVVERPLEIQTEKIIPIREEQSAAKQIIPRLKLSSKYESLQSFKSERQLKENRSNSRLKLRDYIYMVEMGSKTNQKREPQKHLQIEKPQPSPSQEVLSACHRIEPPSQDRKNHPRKECVKSKYCVTNKMMFNILKEDIFTELNKAEATLEAMRGQLGEVESSLEPTNEQLLILYNMRREMKEEINRKLLSTLQQFRNEKKANNLICSKKSNKKIPFETRQI